MYEGRDMTELTMMSKKDWTDDELHFFYFSLQQMTPYLNEEGKSIQKDIILELQNRGGV